MCLLCRMWLCEPGYYLEETINGVAHINNLLPTKYQGHFKENSRTNLESILTIEPTPPPIPGIPILPADPFEPPGPPAPFCPTAPFCP